MTLDTQLTDITQRKTKKKNIIGEEILEKIAKKIKNDRKRKPQRSKRPRTKYLKCFNPRISLHDTTTNPSMSRGGKAKNNFVKNLHC